MAKARAIHLYIESIVMCGFDYVDEAVLTTALQDALTRGLSTLPAFCNAVVPRMSTALTLPAQADTVRLGDAVGKSLATVIGKSGTPGAWRDGREGSARG